jgi:hypothetical protein
VLELSVRNPSPGVIVQKCVITVRCPPSSEPQTQCVGGVFPGQERRRHYRSISLRRTRCLHGEWLVLPGEMQGQSYAAALPRLPFVGSTSKSRLQVVRPMQTIFLRRMVLGGITLCWMCLVKMETRGFTKFMSGTYAFVRPTIPTTILSTLKPGLATTCMHQRPKKILRIVDKLLTLELLYACASSYFLVTL